MAEPSYTVSDSETTGEGKPSSAFPEIAIGIDIGTSQCSVAVWNGSQVELLKNTRGLRRMQSYVTFKNEIPSGGASSPYSCNEHEMFSGSAIFNMKRLIGRMDTDPVVVHSSKTVPFMVQTLGIGARPFIAALVNNVWRSTTSEEALAVFLVELRAMAESQLKRPIRNVVVTVPVSFNRFQLTRIERACVMAGLHVLRLMPEPTAVALLYAQQQLKTVHDTKGSGSEKIALIFNMGAGYCDVAVTATAGGVSHIKALSGSAIGGEDILQNTMSFLLSYSTLKSLCSIHEIDYIESMRRLRIATQDAIHELSSQMIVLVDVDLGNGAKLHTALKQSYFEGVNSDVFEKCEGLVIQCLHDAKVNVEDVNDVIFVGGCSNIFAIKYKILNIFKKKESEDYKEIDPLEAAVRGAALEGAVASGVTDPLGSLDLLTIQVTPMSVGIRADGNNFVPIIHRNTTMPARKELIFTTTHDNQTEALIVVYEGEGEKVEQNHLLGYFKIMGIPAAPEGTPEINLCIDINASNVLKVLAGVVSPTTEHSETTNLFGEEHSETTFIEVRMPNVDDGHGWCTEALLKMYGSTLDLCTVQKDI